MVLVGLFGGRPREHIFSLRSLWIPHRAPVICVLRLYQAMPSLPPLVGWGLVCWWRVWFGTRRSQCRSWMQIAWGVGPRALGGEGPQEVALRVAQWRVAHGVRLDEDFAFAFCSLEEATRDAGPDVAAAWQRARARSADENRWPWSTQQRWLGDSMAPVQQDLAAMAKLMEAAQLRAPIHVCCSCQGGPIRVHSACTIAMSIVSHKR